MNCCDDYGNCNQGRDCPARKKPPCPLCNDTGFDGAGGGCPCTVDDNLDVFLVIVAILLIVTLSAWLMD